MQEKIFNGCAVRFNFKISVTWNNHSASLSKTCDAEQLPSWQNFQSTPKIH